MAEQVLTREDVEVIHDRLTRGDKGVTIARDFAVSQQTVSSIRTGESWAHVTGVKQGAPRARSDVGTLSRDQVLAVAARLQEGAAVTELARQQGVPYHVIYDIYVGASWAWLTGRPVRNPTRKQK